MKTRKNQSENHFPTLFLSLSLSFSPSFTMAAEPVEFTRGSLGAADTRGLSLVERHAEARARALEEETLGRLHAIFSGSSSQVPLSVLALAASAAPGPDAREAEALVREFMADKGGELEKLFKTTDGDGAKAKPSTSSSDDDDDDGSDDNDGEGRKGRHRRSSSSKHKRESRRHSKKHSKKPKKEDKKSKKHKKRRRRSSDGDSDTDESDGGGGGEKRRAKAAAAAATTTKPATASLTSQFGSHGLLRAENPHDAELKRPEFFSWCAEVKKVPSMEALARWEEAELWRTFVEDFNTATLPSEKYYDLAAWQREKAREDAKRRGRKGGEGEEATISAADDEAARRAEAKKRREEEAAERLKEAYNALKYSDAGKKEDMKRQELLKIELQVAARTGDTEKVARLQKLLAPDKT